MIRTKGEAGTGNIVEAVRHMRTLMKVSAVVRPAATSELMAAAISARPTSWC